MLLRLTFALRYVRRDLLQTPIESLLRIAYYIPRESHRMTEYEVGLLSRIWGKAQILRGRPQAALVALEYALEMGVEPESIQPLIEHARELSLLPIYTNIIPDEGDARLAYAASTLQVFI